MSFINFKLKHPNDIIPWGQMGWFALSDGEYWFDLGEVKFFECTLEVMNEWGLKEGKYVNYYLARLVEDLSELFEHIAEPLPQDFYEIAKNNNTLLEFYSKASNTVNDLNDDAITDEDFFRFQRVVDWISKRCLSTIHLISSPMICFFRHDDKLSIIWNAENKLETGTKIWTAGSGQLEMLYSDFVKEAKDFKERIFAAMEKQIDIANHLDFSPMVVDKPRRTSEQAERKTEFEKRLMYLEQGPEQATDWKEIRQLMKELAL